VVYQLELVAKTLQLMEQRVMDSEDKLQEVMTFIKHNDLEYVSITSKILPYFRNHLLSTKFCR